MLLLSHLKRFILVNETSEIDSLESLCSVHISTVLLLAEQRQKLTCLQVSSSFGTLCPETDLLERQFISVNFTTTVASMKKEWGGVLSLVQF